MTFSRRVRFTPRGQRGVREVLQYSWRTWNDRQRAVYKASLDDAFRRIAGFSLLGRQRDDVRPGLRSLGVEQHVILYRVDDEEVVVLRVVHARQDISRLSIP